MGVKEWNDAKIALLIREKNKKNLLIAAEYVRSMAVLICTVDTGHMRGSYDKKVVDDDRARIYNPVEYAVHVELGTSKMKAQPSLRPALYGSTRAVKRLLDLQK